MTSFCPEMSQDMPADTQIVLSSGGSTHNYIKTPLTLKGRGITYTRTNTPENTVPGALTLGWHHYRVTDAALDNLRKLYRVSYEQIL